MIGPGTCAVVIPCLDEAATIAALVREAGRHLPIVMVVDDGSTDGTARLAAAAGAEVIVHPVNRGKGAALKTGLSLAFQRGLSWAVTLDGDGQHQAQDIPALLACAERTGARLVVGNRLRAAAAMPWLRRQVNRWMSRQLSRQAGCALPDTQCGFRLVDLKAWSGLRLAAEHFEAESEMLLAFLAAGHQVEFVPIQVIGRGTRSHIRPWADSIRWWKWWRALRREAGAAARPSREGGIAPRSKDSTPG
jgi:glycosyltransferase involved in cell wall biosynthesis